MEQNYNYKNVFFRRPVLTKENYRLFSIATTVAVILFIIVILSVDWAVNLPDHMIATRVKNEYIAFLEKYQDQMPDADMAANPAGNAFDRIRPEAEQELPVTELKKSAEDVSKSESAYNELIEDDESSIYDQLVRPPGRSVEPITAAIESIPGSLESEIFSGRREKRLTFRGNPEFERRLKEAIKIPEVEHFKFSSENGNRDLHETTAIMEVNEHDIKYCFERHSRYDPTLSGSIKVSFTIHPDGHVIPSSIKIIKSNITDPRIVRCIKRSIERWKNFPKIALEEGKFTVTRKYIF